MGKKRDQQQQEKQLAGKKGDQQQQHEQLVGKKRDQQQQQEQLVGKKRDQQQEEQQEGKTTKKLDSSLKSFLRKLYSSYLEFTEILTVGPNSSSGHATTSARKNNYQIQYRY